VRTLIERQGGDRLLVTPLDDLERLFRDPCRGVRKRLRVAYTTRGFNGTMRVAEVQRQRRRARTAGVVVACAWARGPGPL
jgi:hypothetical protein